MYDDPRAEAVGIGISFLLAAAIYGVIFGREWAALLL
jgi:hypothetical protein